MTFKNVARDRVPVHALGAGKRDGPQLFIERP
jgi:hypothetical protein